MAKGRIALLRGVIHLAVTADYPERILNVLAARGIPFWELERRGERGFSLALQRGDYKRAKAALEAAGAEVSVERRQGVPYFLRRFRRRRALLAGMGVLTALLVVNSLFIWDFEVRGAENVSPTKVLRALEEAGLRRGSFAYAVRPQELCNRILPQFPELAWLTVNVRGCRAYVELRERVEKPEIVTEAEPSNVIAAKDALVTEVRALDGEAMVMKGMTVTKGQLLISGAVETKGVEKPSVTTRFLAGHGEVWGRTWYDLSVKIPLVYEQKLPNGEEKHAIIVSFGTKRVKIGGKDSSNCGAMCDKISKILSLPFFEDIVLPLELGVERLQPYTLHRAERSRESAEQLGERALGDYLRTQIDGEVISEDYSSTVEGEWLAVHLSAECLEQIGLRVPIPMEEG